ncbi:MAG TPA: hypothetical protein GX707_13865 [Epulopiscium sp.]|nr:hypothetical protein [Candidatus Epulonipiscium sp.]
MKKQVYLLLTAIIIVSLFGTTIFANDKKAAIINESAMFLDGEQIRGTGFNVGGNNYFKLRDIADNLSQTSSRFEVTWNSERKLIEIVTGAPYTQVDENDSKWYYNGKKYFGTVRNTKFLVDGKEHNLSVFHIDGSNYFKLRDLSELVGFDMVWNNETDQILLSSKLAKNTYRSTTANDKDNGVNGGFPRWRDTVTSYITQNQDGTISVIEANGDIIIETYDHDYQLIRTKKIAYELPLFGAFYRGEEYNYIAFGQNNTEENNSKEVIRIVRYDHNFERTGSVSVKGGESFTTKPFQAAAGRMAEYGDLLVFHTSRQRYTTSDGLNHQSQLTLIVDTSAMKVLNDLGRFQSNHVSHSFDQYVLFDEKNHVLLDHGDAYPRSVVLSKANGSSYQTIDMFKIPGSVGANCTGVSIGGLEASTANYIVAMNTIDHSRVTQYTSYDMIGLDRDVRDIIIATVPKNSLTSGAVSKITLKKYVGTDENASIPQLVKIVDNKFMVMWQEYNKDGQEADLKYVLIDGQGNPTSGIETLKGFKLSKGQAVVVGNKVTWYVDKKGVRTFYTIPL